MISSVKLENVQSFVQDRISLGKVTVITGVSNSGKSALVRGLRAMLTNSFSSSLIRNGEKTCRVSVVLEDGTELGFVKGADSCYFIGQDRLPKTGREIPKKVLDLLGMKTIQFDKDNEFFLNIQSQMDPQFLVSDQGGVASKVIGRLSNLSIVFIARRRAISEQKALRAQQESFESERLVTKLKLDKIQECERRVEKLEVVSKLDALNSLEEELKSKVETEFLLKEVDLFENNLKKAKRIYELVRAIDTDLDRIDDLLEKSSCLESNKLCFSLSTSSSDRILVLLGYIEECIAYFDSLFIRSEEIKSLILYLRSFSAEQSFLDFKEKEISSLKKEYNSLMSDVCPVCLQKVPDKVREELLNGN